MTATREIIRVGQIEILFLQEGSDTNGQAALFECTVPAGAKVPVPHYHESYDELIYGLEGVITFTVNGQPNRVGPGGSLFIPRGAVHGFTNRDADDAKVLVMITPALIGPDFFMDCGALVSGGGPPDMTKMKEVLLKHGLVAVMP